MLLEFDYPSSKIAEILSPLFISYDLRVANAHLTSKEKSNGIMDSVKERLNLKPDAEFIVIYSTLIEELSSLFKTLEQIISKPSEVEEA